MIPDDVADAGRCASAEVFWQHGNPAFSCAPTQISSSMPISQTVQTQQRHVPKRSSSIQHDVQDNDYILATATMSLPKYYIE